MEWVPIYRAPITTHPSLRVEAHAAKDQRQVGGANLDTRCLSDHLGKFEGPLGQSLLPQGEAVAVPI